MKRNRLFMFFYILLLSMIFYFEFSETQKDRQDLINQNYSIEKNEKIETIFSQYFKPLQENNFTNELWNIVIKKEIQETNITKIQKTVIEVELKDKIICIEKKCFRLIGIFKNEEQSKITLYNEKWKKKLKAFSIGDKIYSSIYVRDIRNNKILFTDKNSTREWSLKLFDINSSKYKPKDFE